MKSALTLLTVLIVVLSSCGIHIQKRLYRNGFYISSGNHREAERVVTDESVNNASITTTLAVPDTSIDETDRLSVTEETKPSSPASCTIDTLHADEQQPASEPSVGTAKEETPPNEVPAGEMESLHTLYISSIVVLVAWLLLAPLSTIVSLVLALIMLKRIRALKAAHTPTANQQTQLEKYRSFETIVLIASIVVLALTLLVLALFLAFFFGALTLTFI